MAGLRQKYEEIAVPALTKEFDYENKMAVPRISEVIVNTSFGKRIKDMAGKKREEFLDLVMEDLAMITGQKPVFTKSRTSISGFDLREGEVIGAKVTLRNERMYDFLERVIHIALPRSRDFRGLRRRMVDQGGNLSLGIKDQTIFPEVDVEGLKESFGFQITVKTNTSDREKALRLLETLGFPLKKEES